MNRIIKNVGVLMLVTLLFSSAGSVIFAQRAQRANRVSDRQVQSLLAQIERRSDLFYRTLETALDNSSLNGTQREDEIRDYVKDFENSADTLKNRFNDRSEVSNDVQDVLNRGANIDRFVRQNRFNTSVTRNWNALRTDLNTLARYYNISWNRNNQNGNNDNNNARFVLDGTYRLNSSQSSNVESEIDRAIRSANISSERQQRVRENALRRLASPDMLAFERRNSTITIASSNSPKLVLEADGRGRSEQMNNGRSMTTTARFTGEKLMIDFTGDRVNDYYLTFDPTINGNRLRVTRRLYLEGINREISVDSVYDRTSNVADWNTVYPNDNSNNDGNTAINESFVVPNGTTLIATLNKDLSTKNSTEGERFSMTVTSPAKFDGAILEGRIAKLERSGRVSGRAEMTLVFDQIRLRDGRNYSFAGFVQNAKSSTGEDIRINNEGDVRSDNSQTKKTATRAGVGAVLGALIGAIAGGGKGAAIGAGIGAGAGAGSVLVQGRDDLELRSGTEITVSASSPRDVARY